MSTTASSAVVAMASGTRGRGSSSRGGPRGGAQGSGGRGGRRVGVSFPGTSSGSGRGLRRGGGRGGGRGRDGVGRGRAPAPLTRGPWVETQRAPDDWVITLEGFLKATKAGDTGGQCKQLIQGGMVYVNGEQDTRRGRKLVVGDEVGILGLNPSDPNAYAVMNVDGARFGPRNEGGEE